MLFCDVAESTSMAEGLDPEEWAEIMNEAFLYMLAPIERYGGTVARMMGDGFLAFFGAPVAHEDDPRRAVLAGLDIQSELAPFCEEIKEDYGLEFAVRVGINTGPVVVGDIGSDRNLEYTAMGDAINLASRMETLAEPGTVQISAYTNRFVAPLFETESLGPIEVKGKGEPVEAYRVTGYKEKPGRLRGIEGLDAPLIGRQQEIDALRNTLTELDNGRGRIVFLLGEAGLGKSRLIRELRASWPAAKDENSRWAQMQGLAYETSRPYSLFHQQMANTFSILQDDTPEEARKKIAQGLLTFPEELRSSIQLAVETLLAVEESSAGIKVEAEALRQDLFAGIRQAWRDEAERYPGVIVFDDLHWSDPASADLLIHLLPLVAEVPLLILGAMRPYEGSEGWRVKEYAAGELAEHYVEFEVDHLNETESNELIDSLLSISDLPASMRQKIQQKAEGNPFFVEEVIRVLIDKGIVRRDESGSHWHAEDTKKDFDIPDSLRALLIGRIDRLELGTKRTLQMASVIGRNFYQRLLKHIAEPIQDISRELFLLQESQLILETARMPELEYMFRHELTRDATYETLLRRQRRRYHRLVGEAIESIFPERLAEEADRLAHHFMEAGDKQRALKYFSLAGERAAKLYANPEAIASYNQAIELAQEIADPDDVVDLFILRGRVFEVSGRYEEAVASYRELESLGNAKNNQRIVLASILAQATVHSTFTDVFDPVKAQGLCEIALGLAQELGDFEAKAKTYWNMMLYQMYSGKTSFYKVIEMGELSLALSREHNFQEQLAYTLNDLVRPYAITGHLDKALAAAEEAGRLFKDTGNLPMYVDNRTNFASGLVEMGRLSEGFRVATEAVEISDKIGTLWAKSFSRSALASALLHKGHLQEAMDSLSKSIRLGNEGNFMGPHFYGGAVIAYLRGTLGDYEDALKRLGELVEETKTMNPFSDWFQPQVFETLLYLDLEDHESAEKRLAKLRKKVAAVENDLETYPLLIIAEARLFLAKEQIQEGIETIEQGMARIEASGFTLYLPAMMAAKGRLLMAGGQTQPALSILRKAAAQAREMGSKWQLLPILRDLATLEEHNGDQAAATETRKEAKEVLNFMIGHLSDRELQQKFLNLPANREIIEG
jgi:predicted ATPase/class 3 adenylate cyclase